MACGWILSAAGGAVGVEGACGWWLPAPAAELGAALGRRSDECCPVAVLSFSSWPEESLLGDWKAALWQALVLQSAAGWLPHERCCWKMHDVAQLS